MPAAKRPKASDTEVSAQEYVEVRGARVNNLKNIDVVFPRNQLVVITGLSGSGKSSLAFDTIYAEGQRRYLESFSAYARQFIGNIERPDVDKINGLSPVISIEQKTISRNPRSTVGTITEIYDFLRLLYARTADAFSYVSGQKMIRLSEDQIKNLLIEKYNGKKILILAPLIRARKGHYRELFEKLIKQGYTKARIDGELKELKPKMQLDRYKIHDIELLVDRVEPSEKNKIRLGQSLQQGLKTGKGVILVMDSESGESQYFSKYLMDPESGISYDEPQPNTFSFNSPYGWCPECEGLGYTTLVEAKSVIPDDSISINRGGIAPLGELRDNYIFEKLRVIAKKHKFSLADPISKISKEALDVVLYGTHPATDVKFKWNDENYFEGIVPMIQRHYNEKSYDAIYLWAEEFVVEKPCPVCQGQRLKKEALHYRIGDKNIAALSLLQIGDFKKEMEKVEGHLDARKQLIAKEILKEIRTRTNFLINVGLDYLTLNSPAKILSGGEAQRIRLATQVGSQLTGILYILDEPSIGLHQRDNRKLIETLKELRDLENTVVVVEHDKEMIEESDYVIDIGPGAGIHGGQVVAQGTASEFIKQNGTTAQYIKGERKIEVPAKRRKGNGEKISLKGASGNNLKQVDVDLPLGKFIGITGVSGSGKSSLINETLYPILHNHFYGTHKKVLPHKSIKGLEHIDKVIEVDQSPIGRTPRSNPATYIGVFNDIRNLFAQLPEAKIRGYKPGRFSFNVAGGRCETCKGGGMRVVEMNFLPDVYVQCEECQGKRYNRETLEVRYKGKSINDVLNMTVEQAVVFFESVPSIYRRIKTLLDVGLGYITLGQSSVTLSGGEAQRIKLATELSKKDTGQTFYILDEPTTGLHFEDINVLLKVLNALVDRGNTVLVIEHNLDVIKVADYLVDLGPEGGTRGGTIITSGTPEEVAKNKQSHTAVFLRKELA